MDLEELVRLLSDYLIDDGETIERRHGAEARDLVSDMVDLMEEQLTAETPFGTLWRDYRKNPRDNEAELIGAMEVMEEANPTFKERLTAFYDAYDFASTDVQPIADTGAPEPNTITVSDIENPVEVVNEMSEEDEGVTSEIENADYSDDRERYNEDEINEANFRYPVWPDYIDEANTYLVGDREDDQSTSKEMYFDEEGAEKADYSAKPADEIDDYDEADEGTDDEPGEI